MNIFKRIWYHFWSNRLHWHNGKSKIREEGILRSKCSRCGKAVVQDGQLNWGLLEKKENKIVFIKNDIFSLIELAKEQKKQEEAEVNSQNSEKKKWDFNKSMQERTKELNTNNTELKNEDKDAE